jgi:hypothetical protein
MENYSYTQCKYSKKKSREKDEEKWNKNFPGKGVFKYVLLFKFIQDMS